ALILYRLFVSCYGHRGNLPSFPTRRSSDLDNIIRLAFTINTDLGQTPQPIGSSWYVAMKIPDPPPLNTFHYRAVHMTWNGTTPRSEEHTSELQSRRDLVCRLLLEKKNNKSI